MLAQNPKDSYLQSSKTRIADLHGIEQRCCCPQRVLSFGQIQPGSEPVYRSRLESNSSTLPEWQCAAINGLPQKTSGGRFQSGEIKLESAI